MSVRVQSEGRRGRGPRRRRGAVAALGVALALSACSAARDGVATGLFSDPANSKLVRAGAAAESAGNLSLATNAYAAASRRNPGATGPRLALARSLLKNGRIEEAQAAFGAVLQKEPRNSEAQIGMGQAHLARGNYQAALAAFEGPRAAGERRALLGTGVALDGLQRHGEAQAVYREVLAADPTDTAARNNLGLSLAFSGQHAEAVETLIPVVKGAGASPRSRQNLALAYALSGDSDAARQIASVDLSPDQVDANLRTLEERAATR